ncbi:MAG: serine hydrolase [Phenylobacterium sp.]|nr:serine hydrolase [Phenylobacterium sp.]
MKRILVAGVLATTVLASGQAGAQENVGVRGTWGAPANSAGAFHNMEELYPSRRIAAGDKVLSLAAPTAPFTATYSFKGKTYDLDAFATNTRTTGLIILRGNKILYERYYQGAGPDSRLVSFSLGKSFVSSLIGVALAEGRIRSLDDRVDSYLPDLKGGAYEGATVRDVLQMSSGTSFDEEYTDGESGIAGFLALFDKNQGGLYDYSRKFKSAHKPGTKFNYASADTEVLGALLAKVTGQQPADYMSDKLWKPMGAEAEARWMLDQPGDAGREVAAGGLLVRLRDYARYGHLVAHDGVADGRQVLPKGWIAQATRPQSPQVEYGKLGGGPLGYGYQWWLIPGPDRAFTGEGIYGQFLMVNPELGLVMVKTSHWTAAWDDAMSEETFALFQALGDQVRALPPER